MRDVVEKAFRNVKERLNLRRKMTPSERSLEGKLFVEFVALIYLSYYIKVVFMNPSPGICYTAGDAVDW